MDEGKGKGLDLILEDLPPPFNTVKALCQRIRDVLFPYNQGLFTGTPQDLKVLYDPLFELLIRPLRRLDRKDRGCPPGFRNVWLFDASILNRVRTPRI
jgi:hypothetical protein